LICDIAINTSQLGFIPANVFCIALYAYNILGWRKQIKAHRDLDRLRPDLDSRASPGKVYYEYESALQPQNTQRILFPGADAAELRLGATCCERSTPSFPDSHRGSPTESGDLWNLLPCRDNPLYCGLSMTEPTAVGR
jgi:hypothetical protein